MKNLKDTQKFAKDFLTKIINDDQNRNIILLQGELGVGKTTFSQYFLEAMGAQGPFTSPTFVIMKKYKLRNFNLRSRASQLTTTQRTKILEKQNVYHLDCYRVDEDSVLDLSWEEIITNKNNLVLVEWPEKIKKIWPKNYWLLKFEYGKNKNSRMVKISKK